MPRSDLSELDDLRLFCAVVAGGGFSPAARELGVPLPTLSRRVAALEQRLGAQLLRRSTRRVEPTDAGQLLAGRAESALRELEDALDCLGASTGAARGRLKLTMPADLMRQWLARPIASFAARYPQIQLDIDLSAKVADLIRERIDLAIRPGLPPDSSLLSRQLASLTQALFASPGYLASMPPITRPAQLSEVNALVIRGRAADRDWVLTRKRQRATARPRGNVSVNDMGALIGLASSGAGVAMLPVRYAQAPLEEGRLQQVLPDWAGPVVPIFAVYTDRRMPARLRLLLDHLRDALREAA